MHHDLLRLFRIETQFHAAFYRRADITQGESDAAGSQCCSCAHQPFFYQHGVAKLVEDMDD